jgi:hypothetical protein
MNYSWYSQTNDPNSSDAVQQILAYGNLDEILSLRKKMGREKLRQVFIEHPKKVYSASSLHFIQKFILHIDKPFDEQQYLKNTPRYIR